MIDDVDSAQKVRTYLDLAAFVDRVADDLAAHPEDWENETLERFLRGWSAWLEDSPGFFANTAQPFPEQPSWSDVAGMILAAKVYE